MLLLRARFLGPKWPYFGMNVRVAEMGTISMSKRVGVVKLESWVRLALTGSTLHSALEHHSISGKIRGFSMSG